MTPAEISLQSLVLWFAGLGTVVSVITTLWTIFSGPSRKNTTKIGELELVQGKHEIEIQRLRDKVEALAARKGRTKIELLYFVGTSWLHRSLASSFRPERLAKIERWWGGPGWRELIDLSQFGLVQRVADRFAQELDYRFVKAYPIYLEEGGNKAAFHLIHASDHPEAPKLMDRAFLKIVGDDPEVIDLRQPRFDI